MSWPGSLMAIGTVVRRRVRRHHGEHRPVGDPLEVLLRADLVVEVVDQERGAEPDEQTDDRGEHGSTCGRRFDRRRREARPTG